MRRALALLLTLATTTLLLAACGEDQAGTDDTTTTGGPPAVTDSSLDEITVTGADGEEPTLDFEAPFGVADSDRRILTAGEGTTVAAGATATFDYVLVNGTDGADIDSSYGNAPTVIPIDEAPPFLSTGLVDVAAGSRVLLAIAPVDAFGADEELGIAANDTLLMLIDLRAVSIPLARAEGASVEPAAGLPTVTLDDAGAPTITVPAGEPPAELVIQPLITGNGAVTEVGQTLTVHYTGVFYSDGAVFDSSWTNGAPIQFELGAGGVLPGWDKGLVGQTVGSQVLLVIPPADAYGEDGRDGIPPNAPLVFVVDILAAG